MSSAVLVDLGQAVNDDGYDTTKVTGSFTPSADRILICHAMFANGGATISGITGHDDGDSWASVKSINGSSQSGHVWACVTGSSPSAGTITVTHSSTKGRVNFYECAADYSAATVAAAIVQSQTFTDYISVATTFGPTMNAFADATNNATVLLATQFDLQATTWTEQGSLTEDYEVVTPSHQMHVSSMVGEDTTPEVNSNNTFSDVTAIGLEIDYVGGGASVAPLARHLQNLMSN